MAESGAGSKDGWAGVVKGRPKVGDVAERSRRTSMADIVAFTEMTGDRNPLHYDRALAERTVFGKLIVQGGVTTGILNALVAEDLPGPGTVFLAVNWKFVKAVGVDEEITGRVEVLTVRPDKPICEISTTVLNDSGDLLATFGPSVASMEAEFRAAAAGRDATIETVLVEDAMTALRRGDAEATRRRTTACWPRRRRDCQAAMR